MRSHRRVIALLTAGVLGLGILGQAGVAAAAEPNVDPVDAALVRPGALDSIADVATLADDTAGRPGTTVGVVTDRNGDAPGGIEVERIVTEPGDVGALTARLDDINGVFSAAPEQRVRLSADPLDASQYGPTRIGARSLPATWDGRGTTVAVVDTGVTGNHPDLTPPLPDGRARIAAGRSFLSGDAANGAAANVDPHGHGTHVAGIITAARDNGLGGSGVAPGAQVLPVRVLNSSGVGWSSDVTAGVLWAHQQGADVINLSLGAPGNTPGDIDTAINFVTTDRSRGKAPTVVVAAAGNSGPNSTPQWPGRQERTIAVAATDANDGIASFSSWGSYVDVAAPGVNVLSTCRTGDWCSMSGTSMATPMVAGAAAVLRQLDPGRGPDEVRARLEATAVDLGSPGRDVAFGAGRIDLAAAALAGASPSSPAQPVMLTGTVGYAFVDRRRVNLGGTAFDPEATATVRVVAAGRNGWAVADVPAPGGRWDAGINVPAGTNSVCAVGVDNPTGTGVLLGCRQLLVK